MSEQGQPHYTDAGFLRRSADSMADAIERLVLLGRLDSRSTAADAALNYRSPSFDRFDTIGRLVSVCNEAADSIDLMARAVAGEDGCDIATVAAQTASRLREAAAATDSVKKS